MPYRNSLTKMIYATEIKKKTPQPFAELRVFIVSYTPLNWNAIFPRMKEILDRLEYTFNSLRIARSKGRIYYTYRIEGTERNVEIPHDEAMRTLETTGLRMPRFGKFYRFAFFIQKNRSYDEVDIRNIERTWIPAETFEEWKSRCYFPEEEMSFEELFE